ncbi:MAG: anhydro-N-acetylmuramic acid kinase [Acetobacteraceae bacterium]|nr:anhydro-N-acetylmuramic acid kinase [Acetobacteraceae bacterium]
MDPISAIGVISGTSMDGIDVALLRTDGHAVVEAGAGRTYDYKPDLRAALLALIADPERCANDPLDSLEDAVSDAHAGAVSQFIQDFAIDRAAVKLVGIHGQTILHRPAQRFTRQLGRGERIAKTLGIDVIYRFRHADVAAGGEGAPFAPLYHQALARRLNQPVMVLNLGGVGNVTYIDGDTILAFDTGPASALLGDFIQRRRGLAYDANGALAGSGRPDPALVANLMAHPYFARPAPKSLDRNDFHAWAQAVDGLSDADGAATFAEFTCASVAAARALVPKPVKRWLVTGGGRHNATFMRRLSEIFAVPVEPVEAVGWHGDFIEAECFAYLAVRSQSGLPLSVPGTTGVAAPMLGGELCRA